MTHNPFDRSGLASLDDLSTPLWHSLFSRLESIQGQFLAAEPHSPNYPWPRDPLHTSTRIWEYPFVYHNLRRWLSQLPDGPVPWVLDLGSGATFFPLEVANLGCRVTPCDVDASPASAYQKAASLISSPRGSIDFATASALALPFPNGSLDGVYCISVLEHIPEFPEVISEVARVLRCGGLFILTVDVALNDHIGLGPLSFQLLRSTLGRSFNLLHPETTVHPLKVLTLDNGPYPWYPQTSLYAARFHIRQAVQSAMRLVNPNLPSLQRMNLTSYGAVLVKI